MGANLSKIISLTLMFLVSGCATNQRFDCKQNNGIKCQSLSEIDRRVTSGEIAQVTKSNSKNKNKTKISNSLYLSSNEFYETKTKLRTNEEIAQIWIAAYETKDGIYHQANTIHTVLKPSEWVNAVSEIEQN